MVKRKLKIAVEGCCHGELDKIYEYLIQKSPDLPDLLIISGDFQAIRNLSDLQCMAVPPKFKRLGDFHAYYNLTKRAPVLTVFVGGNHESSNFLQELPFGGWVAPNIYYLGLSNSLRFAGLSIMGLSGIWGGRDYVRGYFERPPYDPRSLRTVYHVRQYQVKKLLHFAKMRGERPDILVSHDWPRGVTKFGNERALLKAKPFFKDEVKRNELGSPACEELLMTVRPRYWFCAHLHVKFQALVTYDKPQSTKRPRSITPEQLDGIKRNPDEIELSLVDDEHSEVGIGRNGDKVHNPDELEISLSDIEEQNQHEKEKEMTLEEYKQSVLRRHDLLPKSASEPQIDDLIEKTVFLALDKCLPRRQFLEILEIESECSDEDVKLTYDADWLAVTKAYAPCMSTTSYQKQLPDEQTLSKQIAEAHEFVTGHFGNLDIPTDFEQTGPCQNESITQRTPVKLLQNPQTLIFCKKLGVQPPFGAG